MEKKKRKWWLIPVLVVLLAAVTVVVFWDSLSIYIAPKVVLRDAMVTAFSRIEQRFDGNPMLFLLNSMDPDGKQTAIVQLDTSNSLTGDVHYDMKVQTEAHKLLAEGVAETAGKDLDLSVYLDTEFLGVSSQGLFGGNYYGITYSTFAEDIRSIPLLSWFIEDSILNQWEESLLGIQAQMQKRYAVPELPEISLEQMETLTLGLIALPSDIEKATIAVNGETLQCYRITYCVSGKEVQTALEQLLNVQGGEDAAITANFYLCDKALVFTDVLAETGEYSGHLQLELGKNPQSNPLGFVWQESDTDTTDKISMKVTSSNTQEMFSETWNIFQKKGDSETNLDFVYDWKPATGDMKLSVNGGIAANLNLTQIENGIRVETQDFSGLMAALAGKSTESAGSAQAGKCVMTVTKGSQLVTPEYKNLDQWSMGDFLELLSGIGSLFGLSFP